MDLSILVPKAQTKLQERFEQIKSFGIDYSPLDCDIPTDIDVIKMLEFIAKIREDTDSDLPYKGRCPEYQFVEGGREKVLSTVVLPQNSTLYRSLEMSTQLLGIPVIRREEIGGDGVYGLYGEFHLLDSKGVSEQVFGELNWDSRAIYYLFPAQGYVEQDYIQQVLRRGSLYVGCDSL